MHVYVFTKKTLSSKFCLIKFKRVGRFSKLLRQVESSYPKHIPNLMLVKIQFQLQSVDKTLRCVHYRRRDDPRKIHLAPPFICYE